jgi:trans-aconitate methyltransferase
MDASLQQWNSERYARTGRFVSDLGVDALALLAPQPEEYVLDLGCGDGALTEKLAKAGCRVLAVDSSIDQIRAAQARGLDTRMIDAAQLDFDNEFDAVFSNAALHWVKDSDAAIKGIFRALKPGGRFVAEFGGDGNIAEVRAAIATVLERRDIDAARLMPWFFPTKEEYRQSLEHHGFHVEVVELFDRPTPIPGPLSDWLEIFAHPFLIAIDAAVRSDTVQEICQVLSDSLQDAEGTWVVDYVRLRVRASKPA